jgi:hypothetical protein
MILRSALLLASWVGAALSQSASTEENYATTTTSSAIQTWTVSVGKGDNSFSV